MLIVGCFLCPHSLARADLEPLGRKGYVTFVGSYSVGLKLSKVKVQVVIASGIEWAFYFKMGRALLAVWKSSAQEIQPRPGLLHTFSMRLAHS